MEGTTRRGLAPVSLSITVAICAAAASAVTGHASPTQTTASPLVTSAPIDVSPSRITFGSQEAGTTSSSRTVEVSNNQATDLTFSGLFINQGDVADFSISHTNCPHVLAAGAHCQVDVAFRPAAGAFGPRSSTLEVNDDGPNTPQSVTLIGDVVSPNVEVEPSDLSFGAFLPGEISPKQTVTLTNHGSGDLAVTDVKLDPTDDFNLLAGDCLGTIHAGQRCNVDVVYSPKTSQGDVKAIRTAVLSFTDNDPETPTQIVSLDGTVPTPLVELAPSGIDFGDEVAGTRSGARSAVVRNTGTGTMTIQAIEMKGLDPDDFNVIDNTCGGTLAAGHECALSVEFFPQKADNALTALLTITDDAPTVTQTVALHGTATAGRPAAPAPGGSAPAGGGAPAAPAVTAAAAADPAPSPAQATESVGGAASTHAAAAGSPDPATSPGSVDARAARDAAPSAASVDRHNPLVSAILAAASSDGAVLHATLVAVLAMLPFALFAALGWWAWSFRVRRSTVE